MVRRSFRKTNIQKKFFKRNSCLKFSKETKLMLRSIKLAILIKQP